MQYTISRLMDGDESVVENFVVARAKWNELLTEKRDASIEEWAQWLTVAQISFFEKRCGGRHEGQEIMAWSGFAMLYNLQAGFGDNSVLAKKLAEAFEKSTCSMEVKIFAKTAAKAYSV